MAKYSVYAVATGRDPQTGNTVSGLKFTSWNDAKPYITNVSNARYKGFLTETEADAWLCKQSGGDTSLRFTNICTTMGKDPHQVLNSFMEWFVDTFS